MSNSITSDASAARRVSAPSALTATPSPAVSASPSTATGPRNTCNQACRPGAGRDPLELARAQHLAVAEAVLVLERPFQDVGHDLHVAVRVPAEAVARLYPVVIDDAQRPEPHLLRVVVVGEGEGVVGVEPPV